MIPWLIDFLRGSSAADLVMLAMAAGFVLYLMMA